VRQAYYSLLLAALAQRGDRDSDGHAEEGERLAA
jgi:hypothetical protein